MTNLQQKQVNIIIFSMNRAMQLHACLGSLFKNFVVPNKQNNVFKITALWKATDKDFHTGYQKTINAFPEVSFFEETKFKQNLVNLVKDTDDKSFTMFLVDDIIFVAPISLLDSQFNLLENNDNILAISMRLHAGIDTCYATNQKVNVPKFIKGNIWTWTNQEGDWGYSMSVDGNVYRTSLIKQIIELGNYHNPNTFEGFLDAYKTQISKAYLCCYIDAPRLINIPENRVQNDFKNRFADGQSASSLNEKYIDGKMIDFDFYQNLKPNTVHVPMGLKIKE